MAWSRYAFIFGCREEKSRLLIERFGDVRVYRVFLERAFVHVLFAFFSPPGVDGQKMEPTKS